MGDAGRRDYNSSIKFRQVRPGEPIFLILGRDINAGDVVRDWAVRAYGAQAPVALVESALQQADQMDAYLDKKVPDADHLSFAEAKQLAYQFDRRAWKGRSETPMPAIMLAERRGWRQAKATESGAEQLVASMHLLIVDTLAVLPAGELATRVANMVAFTGGFVAGVEARKELGRG